MARHVIRPRAFPVTNSGSTGFASLGRYVVKHPWQIIADWIVAAVVIIALARRC
ncbi:hypothetical protein [Flexivirga caeni]|uniref:hypothetical protein n=1 Tax=Flexivirga caeni TaxID=2294115 RepID=UPI00131554DC|nr:hypothetical protein [Flexivirga caeni]